MGTSSASVDAGPDESGERVGGRYRLRRVIGAGGMGRVWLADDELLRRPVAIKEIAVTSELLDAQLRTMREARAAARLDHPGVVKVFDVVWRPDRSWIVMEYIKSRSLDEVVRTDGPLAHREAARVGLQMLAALRAAHAAGVLHRDVKPHNVLLTDDGRAVLSDFGLATTGDLDAGAEPLMGSPYYVAPERLRAGATGPAGDLWSLGATLYAATEGRPPFARASTDDSLRALMSDEPDPAQHPGPLTPVILDLLTKDPARRPTPTALEPRLRRIAGGAVGVVPVPGDARLPAQRPASAGNAPVGRSRPPTRIPSIRRDSAPTDSAPTDSAPTNPFTADPAPGIGAVLLGAQAPARRRRPILLVSAGVAVVLLGAAGTAVALDSQRDRPAISAAAAPVPSAASTGSASTGSGAAAIDPLDPCGFGVATSAVDVATDRVPAGLPQGWIWHRDPTGFALALPAGWQRSASGTAVCFTDPTGDHAFTVDSAALVTREPLAYWQSREKAAEADGSLPGYQKISMGVLLLKRGGADWEYTWRPDSDTVQHVRRILVATTNRSYLLTWTTSDGAWTAGLPLQRRLVTAFESAR